MTKALLYWLVHVLLVIVGIVFVQVGKPVAVAVGTSIVAAGLCGMVVVVYVMRTDAVGAQLEALQRFGLERIHAARGVRIRAEYDRCLMRRPERIDILGFGLAAFVQDYEGEFASWASQSNVRILLIDPEFPERPYAYARERDEEEGNTAGDIERDVHDFVRRVGPILGQYQDSFSIRLYRCIPSINIFRIGEVLFWGPYLIGDQSRNMPTFEIREGGSLFSRFNRHFDTIWKSNRFSRPVPGQWLDR